MIRKIRPIKKVGSIRYPYKRWELAKDILMGLAAGGIIVSSFAVPNVASLLKFFNPSNSREREKISRNLKSLKEKKLIEIYDNDGLVAITEKGNKQVLKYQIDELKISRPKKWDKKWRIITFDVPERFKKARDALSKKIKNMEIRKMQKSVYVCPFDCENEIDFVCEVFNVRKYVRYIVAENIGEDEELKRFYNL